MGLLNGGYNLNLLNGIKICLHRNCLLMSSFSFKANYFSTFSRAPVVCKLAGRKVLDGVGQPTLEVEIYCTVKNYEKV